MGAAFGKDRARQPQIGHTIAASIKKIAFIPWQWVDLPIILTQMFQVIQFTFIQPANFHGWRSIGQQRK